MGRKLSPDALYRRAQGNGYKYAAHHEEHSERVDGTYIPNTIRDQKSVLDRDDIEVLQLREQGHSG